MEIPRHWAEHREQRTLAGRRAVTLRRFGWSSASPSAAQAHAVQRVAEAWASWDAGRKPTRREAKVAYNGAAGLPIREEIISEHPEIAAVVTRNGYGARCLNVADILFADLDLGTAAERWSSLCATVIGFALAIGLLAGVALATHGGFRLLLAGVAVTVALCAVWRTAVAWRHWRRAIHPELALRPLHRWCAVHPSWRVHVYRTPAGFRLLATHAVIDPQGVEAATFFTAIACDPLFVLMCRKQACFRARVSPKPWRIGIAKHIGWGTWPVVAESALTRRTQWVDAYEDRSRGFAACAWLHEVGDGAEHPRGRAVRELHDRLCGSGSSSSSSSSSGKPLA